MAVNDLSDAELLAALGKAPQGAPDVEGMVRSEAQRQGLDPDFAVRIAKQESGLRPDVVSPKGAIGVMQLMPDTAAGLGVDPHDLAQNVRGGITYLKQQRDRFGNPRLAAAAYNAGPDAVEKYGDVPPFKETQDYVAATSPGVQGLSNAELLAALKPAAKPPPARPAPGPAPKAAAPPTIAQDALSGFLSPFQKLGHDVMTDYRNPKGADALQIPRYLGDVLGLASAPVQAVVRPTARAIGNAIPMDPHTGGGFTFQDGKLSFQHGQTVTGDAKQALLEGGLNTALSGVRAAGPKAIAAVKPTPRTLAELNTDQNAAWRAVDASGYRFPQPQVQGAAADIRKIVDDAGPDLYKNADLIAKRAEDLAARGDLTPAQANRLRSQVGEKLLAPGSDEASVGREIKARIDQLIDTNAQSNSLLADARTKYTQYVKMKDVSDRLNDAGIDQAASGTGGNANATRQALKPMVKNRSPQKMRNGTPDEMAALKAVVNGTPVQNLLRVASAFDPFHGKLGALLQGVMGATTHGLSAASIPLGMAATAGERAIGAKNVQSLLDLISTGGVKPAAPGPAPYPTLALGGRPAQGLLAPRGLAGAGEVAAPLARIPSPQPKKKAGSQAR